MADIKLPNGKVVKGVPDDINKFKFMEMVISKGLATPEDFGQESASPVTGSGFKEGIGRGLVSLGRGAGNMVGLISDEDAAESNRLDEPLLKTGGGMAGNIVGQIAGTAPLGGAVGAVAKGLTGVRALAPAARGVVAALRNPLSRGAIEGATQGALTADPNERLKGAAVGGALGGALGVVGKGAKAVTGKLTAELSDDAKKLQDLTGTFIPLSHSLKPGMWKQFYEAFLANLPGVAGKIRGQFKNAEEDLRRYAGEQAHPPLAGVHIDYKKDDVLTVFQKLRAYWDHAYDDVKDIDISLFSGVGGRRPWSVPKVVSDLIARRSEGTIVVPGLGAKTAKGGMIVELRRAAEEILEGIPKDSKLKAGKRKEIEAFIAHLDDTMKQSLDPSGKGRGAYAKFFREYRTNNEYYGNWKTLQDAGKKAASDSRFTGKQLATVAAKKEGSAALGGGAADSMQELGRLGGSVLKDFPSREGLYQTVAALGLGGSLAGAAGAGVLGSTALAAPIYLGLGRAMASKGAQQLVSGQKQIMKRYATLLRRLGRVGRAGAVEAGEEYASR